MRLGIMSYAYASMDVLTAKPIFFFFFFNDTATTEIYTLSLHDALPILLRPQALERDSNAWRVSCRRDSNRLLVVLLEDRKSTRLNSSHLVISYAVFCLKKKKRKRCIVS